MAVQSVDVSGFNFMSPSRTGEKPERADCTGEAGALS